VTGEEIDRSVRHELRSLGEAGSATVAKRLVMVARLLETDPEAAWAHAQEALRSAGRLSLVREAAGLAAYHAGQYAEALRELRAHRRMSGSNEHWPVMADCERGLGRPEKALQMAGAPEVATLDRAASVEMRIVAAGARADLGQHEAAVVTLQSKDLGSGAKTPWVARLRYAYAEALLAVGRVDEAREWFQRAADSDTEDMTDALDRVAELDGVVLESVVDEDADEDADSDDESGEGQPLVDDVSSDDEQTAD
jgi:tetratricopeptide (TPR) repeat protein